MRRPLLAFRAAVLFGGLLLAHAAQAQTGLDSTGAPRHGTLRLRSGFGGDPVRRPILAGGTDSVAVGACGGFVAGAAPALGLRFAPGRFALTLTAVPRDDSADTDLVLIVRTPDGKWLCDDDSAGDLHPRLVIRKPRPGAYLIWVGAYGAGAPVQARVGVSELGHGVGG